MKNFFDIKSEPTKSGRWSGDGWEVECNHDLSRDVYRATIKIQRGLEISVTDEDYTFAINKLEFALRQTNGVLNVIIHKTGLK